MLQKKRFAKEKKSYGFKFIKFFFQERAIQNEAAVLGLPRLIAIKGDVSDFAYPFFFFT